MAQKKASLKVELVRTVEWACVKSCRRKVHSNTVGRKKLEDTEGNASDRKSLLTKITSLRPKKFSEGTLVFGLQHDSVQTHIFKDG